MKTPEKSVEFKAGDYVVFPEGLKCTWEIKKKIRKHYKFGWLGLGLFLGLTVST